MAENHPPRGKENVPFPKPRASPSVPGASNQGGTAPPSPTKLTSAPLQTRRPQSSPQRSAGGQPKTTTSNSPRSYIPGLHPAAMAEQIPPRVSGNPAALSFQQPELPPPPPGFKWFRTAVLVSEREPCLEDIYDARIPPNLEQIYPTIFYLGGGAKGDFARRINKQFEALLIREGFRNLVLHFGIGEIKTPGPSGPCVFAVIMHEHTLGEWQKIDELVRGFVASSFTKEDALWYSSEICPQYQVPIRYYYNDNIGYSGNAALTKPVTTTQSPAASTKVDTVPLIVNPNDRIPLETNQTKNDVTKVNGRSLGLLFTPPRYEETTLGQSVSVVDGYGDYPRAGRSLTICCEDVDTKRKFDAELSSMQTILPTIDHHLLNLQIMGTSAKPDLLIESPARRQALIEEETHRSNAGFFDVEYAKTEARITTQNAHPDEQARDVRLLQELDTIRQLEYDRAAAIPMDRVIGRLILTSGIRTKVHTFDSTFGLFQPPNGVMMDYALLDIDKGFEGHNKLPPISRWSKDLGEIESGFENVFGHKYIHGVADLIAGERVLLFGGTTGLRYGTVEQTQELFTKLVYQPGQSRVKQTVDSFEAYVRRDAGKTEFAAPGDSGQPIFNKKGECVALVLGGPARSKDHTCITPIKAIFEDLEIQFGVKVLGLKLPALDIDRIHRLENKVKSIPAISALLPPATASSEDATTVLPVQALPSRGKGRKVKKGKDSAGRSTGYGLQSSGESEAIDTRDDATIKPTGRTSEHQTSAEQAETDPDDRSDDEADNLPPIAEAEASIAVEEAAGNEASEVEEAEASSAIEETTGNEAAEVEEAEASSAVEETTGNETVQLQVRRTREGARQPAAESGTSNFGTTGSTIRLVIPSESMTANVEENAGALGSPTPGLPAPSPRGERSGPRGVSHGSIASRTAASIRRLGRNVSGGTLRPPPATEERREEENIPHGIFHGMAKSMRITLKKKMSRQSVMDFFRSDRNREPGGGDGGAAGAVS